MNCNFFLQLIKKNESTLRENLVRTFCSLSFSESVVKISALLDSLKINKQKLSAKKKLGLHSEVYVKILPKSKRNRELVDDILVQFFTVHLSVAVRLIFFQLLRNKRQNNSEKLGLQLVRN